MQYQRQTKRSTSLVPSENRVKLRHEGQYLPSYKCCKEPRRLPEVKDMMLKLECDLFMVPWWLEML